MNEATKTDPLLVSLGFQESTAQEEEVSSEVSLLSTDAITAAKTDLNFLAGLAIPDTFKYFFPSLYLNIWAWLLDHTTKLRAFPQLAIGLPRGFAKTTFVKLYILYCILFTEKKFILVISATATLAQNIISDIADILDSPNIKVLFGNWRLGIEKDTQDLKKFGFRGRNIILAGLGVEGSLRGLNIKNERPDVMIFEDVQTREAADSQVQSLAIEKWMFSTAMKAKSPSGCIYLFIANMYPTKWSILRKLKQNPTWTKFIAGAILLNGESIWEELQPLEQLMQEFQNDLIAGHPEIFYAEVLNDENASVNNTIDIASLPAYPFDSRDISAGSFIIIDPSGDKANSDNVSIGAFDIYNATPCLVELLEDKLSPGDTIRKALEMALRRGILAIGIESTAYQYSLLYWFNFILAQAGLEQSGIQPLELYSGTMSKNSRILTAFKELKAGELYYHPDIASQVNSQITQFNPLRRDNTDGILDLLTYAKKMIELYGLQIQAATVIQGQEFASLTVIENNTNF